MQNQPGITVYQWGQNSLIYLVIYNIAIWPMITDRNDVFFSCVTYFLMYIIHSNYQFQCFSCQLYDSCTNFGQRTFVFTPTWIKIHQFLFFITHMLKFTDWILDLLLYLVPTCSTEICPSNLRCCAIFLYNQYKSPYDISIMQCMVIFWLYVLLRYTSVFNGRVILYVYQR